MLPYTWEPLPAHDHAPLPLSLLPMHSGRGSRMIAKNTEKYSNYRPQKITYLLQYSQTNQKLRSQPRPDLKKCDTKKSKIVHFSTRSGLINLQKPIRFTLPTLLEARSNPELSIHQSFMSIGQKYEKFRPKQGPQIHIFSILSSWDPYPPCNLDLVWS